jgi:hypothetical protein
MVAKTTHAWHGILANIEYVQSPLSSSIFMEEMLQRGRNNLVLFFYPYLSYIGERSIQMGIRQLFQNPTWS